MDEAFCPQADEGVLRTSAPHRLSRPVPMKRGVVWADGGIRGNPGGVSACAAVLYVDGEMPRQKSKLIGGRGTSNQAEYYGLMMALRLAAEFEVTHLKVRLDSKLVVEQVLGNWRVKQPALLPLRDRARELAAMYFEEVRIGLVPREENTEADRICTRLLDNATGRVRGKSRR